MRRGTLDQDVLVTGSAPPAAASPAPRGPSSLSEDQPATAAWMRVRLSPTFQLALAGLALFAVALAPRLIGLEQHLTADDQSWVRRATRFGMAVQRGRLRQTYQSVHPGVPVLWLSSLAIGPERLAELRLHVNNRALLEKSPSYLDAVFATRRALALASAGLTVLLAFLVWRLFGPGPAVLAGLLLANEPFLVAHGRLFHTDPLLAQLMAISILSALIFFEGRGGLAYLFGSGVATGLAFLTKVPSCLPVRVYPAAGSDLRHSASSRRALLAGPSQASWPIGVPAGRLGTGERPHLRAAVAGSVDRASRDA